MGKKLRTCADAVVCGMPLISYGYVLLFWLLASAASGRWARPSLDDPTDFFSGIPQVLGDLLMVLSFSVAPLVLYLGYRRGKTAVYVLVYGACLVASIILFRLDILHITAWIAD